MRHMHSVDRPLCALESSVETAGDVIRSVFGNVECEDCLRRAIAEGTERIRVLRDLLSKVEVVS